MSKLFKITNLPRNIIEMVIATTDGLAPIVSATNPSLTWSNSAKIISSLSSMGTYTGNVDFSQSYVKMLNGVSVVTVPVIQLHFYAGNFTLIDESTLQISSNSNQTSGAEDWTGIIIYLSSPNGQSNNPWENAQLKFTGNVAGLPSQFANKIEFYAPPTISGISSGWVDVGNVDYQQISAVYPYLLQESIPVDPYAATLNAPQPPGIPVDPMLATQPVYANASVSAGTVLATLSPAEGLTYSLRYQDTYWLELVGNEIRRSSTSDWDYRSEGELWFEVEVSNGTTTVSRPFMLTLYLPPIVLNQMSFAYPNDSYQEYPNNEIPQNATSSLMIGLVTRHDKFRYNHTAEFIETETYPTNGFTINNIGTMSSTQQLAIGSYNLKVRLTSDVGSVDRIVSFTVIDSGSNGGGGTGGGGSGGESGGGGSGGGGSTTSVSNAVLVGGKAVGAVSVDPRTSPVRVTISGVEQALPTGSVVRLSSTGQKFLKVSGDEFAFTAISVTPPAEWSWSAGGSEAWSVLQSF